MGCNYGQKYKPQKKNGKYSRNNSAEFIGFLHGQFLSIAKARVFRVCACGLTAIHFVYFSRFALPAPADRKTLYLSKSHYIINLLRIQVHFGTCT